MPFISKDKGAEEEQKTIKAQNYKFSMIAQAIMGEDEPSPLNKSSFDPHPKLLNLIKSVKEKFRIAKDMRDRGYPEFGIDDETGSYLNLAQRIDLNEQLFNQLKTPKSQDPDLSWRSNAINPLSRKKVILFVASLVNAFLYPEVFAQNDDAKEDKEMAKVMSDAMRWARDRMEYDDLMIDTVQEICVSPAVFLKQNYSKVFRNVKKEKDKDGNWKVEQILDDIFSGFKGSMIPAKEVYLGNIAQRHIQKQPYIFQRKMIDHATALRKYGGADNFKFIKPGVNIFFDDQREFFYEITNNEHNLPLLEEIIYWDPVQDLEIPFLGGIPMYNDHERPNPREDKLIPFASTVFETFHNRFFYGMSLVQKIAPEQEMANKLYRLTEDGVTQELAPAVAFFGTSDLDPSAMTPRTITQFEDPNIRFETLNTGKNLNAAFGMMSKVERSISESSQDPRAGGIPNQGSQTKFEVETLEKNAQKILGRTGKMISKLVGDFGWLTLNSILQYMPLAELSELTADSDRADFATLFLPPAQKGGQAVKIDFTEDMPEGPPEELEKRTLKERFKLLQEEIESGTRIYKVSPSAFKKRKYLLKVEPVITNRSMRFAELMAFYDRGINNPIINKEALTKKTLLKRFSPGEEEEFITNKNEILQKADELDVRPAGTAPETSPEQVEL